LSLRTVGTPLKTLGGRGAVAVLSLSLYTKGAAAGNWPKGRGKVRKCKGWDRGPVEGGGEQGSGQMALLTIVVITSIIAVDDLGGGP
jgi:hypothetical protein